MPQGEAGQRSVDHRSPGILIEFITILKYWDNIGHTKTRHPKPCYVPRKLVFSTMQAISRVISISGRLFFPHPFQPFST